MEPSPGARASARTGDPELRAARSHAHWALPKLNDVEVRRVLRVYERTGNQHLRDAIVDAFLPVVRGVVQQQWGAASAEHFEHGVCVGVAEVLRAIECFDWHGARSFERYCAARIESALREA